MNALGRKKQGREPQPSYGIIDLQSAKTLYVSEARGIDGGRQARGHKRHLLVEVRGNLLHVQVRAANIHDTVAAGEISRREAEKHPHLEAFSGDAGYRGTAISFIEKKLNLTLHISDCRSAETLMEIRRHANATTTPKQRAPIPRSSRPVAERAVELGVSETTVRRWRARDTVQDRPHTPQRLATTLNPLQEFVGVEWRKLLLPPLDDPWVVARECVGPKLSRSALDRCPRRHGVARLADRLAEAAGKPPLPKTFKTYEPGFVQVDIKYLPRMPDEAERRYRLAAIDRASRWVYFEIQPDKTAATAARFLERPWAKAPFLVRTVLTDNGKEFTDRFRATGEREPTGRHAFDQTCAAHGINHRLIKPKHPQPNGMIERFNSRVAEVLRTTTFASARHLETALQKYLHLYNHDIPQKNLGHVTPVAKLKEYYHTKPTLFQKRPINHPGPDSLSVPTHSHRSWQAGGVHIHAMYFSIFIN